MEHRFQINSSQSERDLQYVDPIMKSLKNSFKLYPERDAPNTVSSYHYQAPRPIPEQRKFRQLNFKKNFNNFVPDPLVESKSARDPTGLSNQNMINHNNFNHNNLMNPFQNGSGGAFGANEVGQLSRPTLQFPSYSDRKLDPTREREKDRFYTKHKESNLLYGNVPEIRNFVDETISYNPNQNNQFTNNDIITKNKKFSSKSYNVENAPKYYTQSKPAKTNIHYDTHATNATKTNHSKNRDKSESYVEVTRKHSYEKLDHDTNIMNKPKNDFHFTLNPIYNRSRKSSKEEDTNGSNSNEDNKVTKLTKQSFNKDNLNLLKSKMQMQNSKKDKKNLENDKEKSVIKSEKETGERLINSRKNRKIINCRKPEITSKAKDKDKQKDKDRHSDWVKESVKSTDYSEVRSGFSSILSPQSDYSESNLQGSSKNTNMLQLQRLESLDCFELQDLLEQYRLNNHSMYLVCKNLLDHKYPGSCMANDTYELRESNSREHLSLSETKNFNKLSSKRIRSRNDISHPYTYRHFMSEVFNPTISIKENGNNFSFSK